MSNEQETPATRDDLAAKLHALDGLMPTDLIPGRYYLAADKLLANYVVYRKPEQAKLDPKPWFRWCDSEMPGAPSFERYAKQGNHTEFNPRPEYSQRKSVYGIEAEETK